MKTVFTTLLIFGCLLLTQAQNSLLQSPQTGQPFTSGSIDDIAIISNGSDVALVAANNTTGKLYVFDIDDNDPAEAVSNTVTSVPAFKTKIQAALGVGNVTIINFEANPISRSIYVLAKQGASCFIVIVKDGGNTFSSLDLNTTPYSTLIFSNGSFNIQDLTWGNNTLFISTSNSALDGEIGYIQAPFAHNTVITKRATTMFKSNWGNTYWTDAPLEKMDFITIDGTERLTGVTVCAPGFSFPTSTLTGSGLLSVTEHFDMNTGPTLKVVAVSNDSLHYLIDLHDFDYSGNYAIYRIGKKYIDGSQLSANNINSNADKLRADFTGMPATGLTEKELKKYDGFYTMIAFYTNCELLALTKGDVLTLITIDEAAPPCLIIDETSLGENGFSDGNIILYPNPAAEQILIKHQVTTRSENISLSVRSMDGKEMLTQRLAEEGETKLNISSLPKGSYLVCIYRSGKPVGLKKFLK